MAELTLTEHVVFTLSLWITTHAAADFFTNMEARRPLSCQLCLSGWVVLLGMVVLLAIGSEVCILMPLAWWAVSVLIEAVHQRLQMLVL